MLMCPPAAVHQFALGPWKNLLHLIGDLSTGECAVIDPAWHAPTILAAATQRRWRITHVLCTHSHVDHVNQVDTIVAATQAQVHMHAAEVRFAGFTAENLQCHGAGEQIEVGRLSFTALHTPGHTPGSCCYWQPETGALFTGDTLFVNGCGRCDLPGGDPQDMFTSLNMLKQTLPATACIYPGHDYGPNPTSTMGYEAKNNRFMVLPSLQAFVDKRMPGRTPPVSRNTVK